MYCNRGTALKRSEGNQKRFGGEGGGWGLNQFYSRETLALIRHIDTVAVTENQTQKTAKINK